MARRNLMLRGLRRSSKDRWTSYWRYRMGYRYSWTGRRLFQTLVVVGCSEGRMSTSSAPAYDETREHTVRPGDIPGRNCASIRLASSISLRVLFFRLPLGHSQVTFDFLHACYQCSTPDPSLPKLVIYPESSPSSFTATSRGRNLPSVFAMILVPRSRTRTGRLTSQTGFVQLHLTLLLLHQKQAS